jgi:hypothetical protein
MFNTKMNQETDQVERAIHRYLDSYLNAEADDLARVFHPDSHLFTVGDGGLEKTPLSDWLVSLRQRKARNERRQAEVSVSGVDITGQAAVAKAVLKFREFQFIDYLSLLKIEGEWRIINKIYASEALA